MASGDFDAILTALGVAAWAPADRLRGRSAAFLALTIYAGHTRDQGTPYLEHPLAVVAILRDELTVTVTGTLLLGLLHDALEVSPSSGPLITARLGEEFTERLRTMTPDHRLEQRSKEPGDEAAWRAKTARLGAEELVVRLADRIHNLRDLVRSPSIGRREKFLSALAGFYLPLAESARASSLEVDAAYRLLHAEYERHRPKT
ncbi:HD domain-containing protein [Planomonospora sp. ID82291]|uniref:HD domain-containing protein n=1 Tax=Planomonospora sp. ID82291 TaxID=2738136 RepID=UPI0018C3E282|nr:HD domain-containing protein [Planomonospora sp. ID82291]MBG0818685.1 HD domain-containing protein [Planomonospora sp. ID82291]